MLLSQFREKATRNQQRVKDSGPMWSQVQLLIITAIPGMFHKLCSTCPSSYLVIYCGEHSINTLNSVCLHSSFLLLFTVSLPDYWTVLITRINNRNLVSCHVICIILYCQIKRSEFNKHSSMGGLMIPLHHYLRHTAWIQYLLVYFEKFWIKLQ